MLHMRISWIAAVGLAAIASGVPATVAAHEPPPRVFVYSGTSGFRRLSINRAKEVLALAAEGGRYTFEFSEDPASLNADTLARADVVVWLSTTGSTSPLTDAQEQA